MKGLRGLLRRGRVDEALHAPAEGRHPVAELLGEAPGRGTGRHRYTVRGDVHVGATDDGLNAIGEPPARPPLTWPDGHLVDTGEQWQRDVRADGTETIAAGKRFWVDGVLYVHPDWSGEGVDEARAAFAALDEHECPVGAACDWDADADAWDEEAAADHLPMAETATRAFRWCPADPVLGVLRAAAPYRRGPAVLAGASGGRS